jgi:hypothetical protein
MNHSDFLWSRLASDREELAGGADILGAAVCPDDRANSTHSKKTGREA